MRLEINPPNVDADYLHCLNACFPHWGGTQMAQWVFSRALPPDPLPDRMILREDAELLAGSAVSYRTVTLPNGNTLRAGIMTGSWTLPAARGRGCFSRIIEGSAAITREREGTLLLAFVTEDNPSCRQLAKAGAAMVPTWYCFTDADKISEPQPGTEAKLQRMNSSELTTVFDLWATSREQKCRFTYSSFESWKSQWIDRPTHVDAVRNDAGAMALIERHETTDRILACWGPSGAAKWKLIENLYTSSRNNNRKLFLFSTNSTLVSRYEEMGLVAKPGYLAMLVTDWKKMGEAMQTDVAAELANDALLKPASPWFVGEWELQSGDRM